MAVRKSFYTIAWTSLKQKMNWWNFTKLLSCAYRNKYAKFQLSKVTYAMRENVRMSIGTKKWLFFWRYYNVTLTLHVFVTFIIFQNVLYFTEHILVPINPLFYKYVCIRYYISKDLRISQGTCLLPLNSFKLMQRNSAISEIQLRLIINMKHMCFLDDVHMLVFVCSYSSLWITVMN